MGVGGGAVLGVRTSPPSLWNTPKLHKEGENAACVCAKKKLSEILYLPLHIVCYSSSLDSAGSSSYRHEGHHTWRSPIDEHLKYRDYQNKTVLKKTVCVQGLQTTTP